MIDEVVLAPGFEPGSRSNLELTGYKPAALPFVLRQAGGIIDSMKHLVR